MQLLGNLIAVEILPYDPLRTSVIELPPDTHETVQYATVILIGSAVEDFHAKVGDTVGVKTFTGAAKIKDEDGNYLRLYKPEHILFVVKSVR